MKARKLQADGTYKRVKAGKKPAYRGQQVLFEEACRLVKEAERSKVTMFEPHRAPGHGE